MGDIYFKFIKIYKRIKGSKNVLLLVHNDPDGDCIGAAGALFLLIKEMGININIFLEKMPCSFNFLNLSVINNVDFKEYDLFIMLDANSLGRCGICSNIDKKNIIIFDHHKKNDDFIFFEDVILPETASTCEIIFNFFMFLNAKIDSNIATFLLMGVLTDTSNFNNLATNIDSIDVAKKLMLYGADLKIIQTNLFKNKRIGFLNIWELLLGRLKKNKRIGLAWTYISNSDVSVYDIKENDLSAIPCFMNDLDDSNIGMIMKNVGDNKIKFSLRTTKNINLLKLANLFGGGGHKRACGFEIRGRIVNEWGKVRIED